jgi:hypothetical protein
VQIYKSKCAKLLKEADEIRVRCHFLQLFLSSANSILHFNNIGELKLQFMKTYQAKSKAGEKSLRMRSLSILEVEFR